MRRPGPRFLLGLVSLWVAGAALRASENPTPDLSTPRRAVESLLRHLGPEAQEPDPLRAADCLDTSSLPGSADQQRARGAALGSMLGAVIDAREISVAVEGIPDQPDAGVSLIPLHPELDGVYLSRTARGWQIAASSLKPIERLHRHTFGRISPSLVNRLPAWLTAAPFGLAIWQLLGIALAMVTGLAARRLVLWLLGVRARRLADGRSEPIVGDALASATRPLGLLAVSLTIRLFWPELQFGPAVTGVVRPSLTALSTWAIVWLLYCQIDVLGRWMETLTAKTESRLDDQLVPLVRKSLKALVVVLGVIFLLHNLGVQVTSLIAGLGIGGLAVALAAQETLSNFFASLVILIDRPFRLGDLVSAGDVTGTVEQVGLRSTRIRLADRSLVTVPNAKLAGVNLRNLGARSQRLLVFRLNLSYDSPADTVDRALGEIGKILDETASINRENRVVVLDALSPSSIDVLIECYADVETREEELRVRHHLVRALLTVPHRAGVRFAYPTQTLHVSGLAAVGNPPPERAATPPPRPS